jgi:hypothetical protein
MNVSFNKIATSNKNAETPLNECFDLLKELNSFNLDIDIDWGELKDEQIKSNATLDNNEIIINKLLVDENYINNNNQNNIIIISNSNNSNSNSNTQNTDLINDINETSKILAKVDETCALMTNDQVDSADLEKLNEILSDLIEFSEQTYDKNVTPLNQQEQFMQQQHEANCLINMNQLVDVEGLDLDLNAMSNVFIHNSDPMMSYINLTTIK